MERKRLKTENGQNIDRDGSKDGQKMDKLEKEHTIIEKWIEKGLNMVRI